MALDNTHRAYDALVGYSSFAQQRDHLISFLF
jgi:hypothetical protein